MTAARSLSAVPAGGAMRVRPSAEPQAVYIGSVVWSQTAVDAGARLGMLTRADLDGWAQIAFDLACEVVADGGVPTIEAIAARAYATAVVGRGQRLDDLRTWVIDAYLGCAMPSAVRSHARAVIDRRVMERVGEMSRRTAQLADEGQVDDIDPVLDAEREAIRAIQRRRARLLGEAQG